ncbi:transcription factor bHLH10-like isoform X2 [Euphorbia lathyris]|uniref:transcription factor bHLH10-like isoform X2 n=1 Tax=Euphorbia lathyris TaxID=212925 RepID=UPI0033144071
MYQQTDSFEENNNHRLSTQDLSSAAMEIQLQNHLEMAALLQDSSSNNHLLPFNSSLPVPDLTLYHLSKCSSFLPNSSISFTGDLPMPDISSDPILYLPQPPLIRDLFQSPLYQDCEGEQQIDDGVMEFNFNMGKGGGAIRKSGKVSKQFVNERQRRVHVKDTYQILRDLVPNPTKKDRASIVGDAIGYIKELMRSVNELKMLVEKKRCRSGNGRDRNIKRLKTEEELDSTEPGGEEAFKNGNGSLRSSWLQRKSKDSEVDVRIIDDEVTIKLVQRKRMNRLLYVSKVLDELHLDLHHVAGGHVGDYYSFLFNTKITEGSCVYATAIANRIMEVLQGPNASTPSYN